MHEEDEDFVPEDHLAALRADLDQMISLTPEIARAAAGWYAAFIGVGFNDKQALYLAAAEILQNPRYRPVLMYLTRNGRLFELVAEDVRRNYGLGPTFIREAALKDVVTEDVVFATGPTIATYRPLKDAA